ncbi:MAG: threonine synthase [Acidobacteriota bacterium]
MRCISTDGTCPETDLAEALYTGLAPDGSLYMPRQLDPLEEADLRRLAPLPLPESATVVARHLLRDALEPTAVESLIHDTLDFEIPLVPVEEGHYVLELFHGPTLAFKDVGARFMARLMRALQPPSHERLTILVATSGDTGSAVAHAFAGLEGFDVAVLFPHGKVSEAQQKLFTTIGGNVRSFAVDGTFDDCQRMVKECFADADLRARRPLGSANSINLGRLLPQSFYYLHLLHELTEQGLDPWSIDLRIVTPSGNFGNLTAGLFARRLGLPCRFVAATNANDVVPQFLDGRPYQPRPSVRTLSNAMDVGAPSNFDRILHLYQGDEEALRKDVAGVSVDDELTLETIAAVFQRTGYVLDPHTAVGYLALEKAVPPGATGVVLATAHPAKFANVVERATGRPVVLPPALADCLDREEFVTALPPEASALREELLGTG